MEIIKAEWPPATGTIRSNPVKFANPRISFAHAIDRLEASSWSSGKCRDELEQVLERCVESPGFPHAEISRMEVICERLAACGECNDDAVGAWLNIANRDPDREPDLADYRAGAALLIIRYGKLRPPVEKLVRLFDYDWDWHDELIDDAIVAGGDRETLLELLRIFPGQPWHAKLFLSNHRGRSASGGRAQRSLRLRQQQEI